METVCYGSAPVGARLSRHLRIQESWVIARYFVVRFRRAPKERPSATHTAIIVGMMKTVLAQCSGLLLVGLVICSAQGKKAPASPPAETSVMIGGKQITIKYAAPSMRGRKTF